MGTETPCFALRWLVNFIVHLYLPSLISIRAEDSIVAGSKHFLQMVMLSKRNTLQEEKVMVRQALSVRY